MNHKTEERKHHLMAIQMGLGFVLYVPAVLVMCKAPHVAIFLDQRMGWHCTADNVRYLIGLPIILVYFGIRIALGRYYKKQAAITSLEKNNIRG